MYRPDKVNQREYEDRTLNFKKGDVIFVLVNFSFGDIINPHGRHYGQLGIITEVRDNFTFPYLVRFYNGIYSDYVFAKRYLKGIIPFCDEEIRIATEKELDKFYLERYRDA